MTEEDVAAIAGSFDNERFVDNTVEAVAGISYDRMLEIAKLNDMFGRDDVTMGDITDQLFKVLEQRTIDWQKKYEHQLGKLPVQSGLPWQAKDVS